MKKFKLYFFALLSILVFLSINCSDEITGNEPAVEDIDSTIEAIIKSININTVGLFVRELTGNEEVEIDGRVHKILSRMTGHPGKDLAADYIEEKLNSYGLSVTNQHFLNMGRNVIATQYGSEFPNNYYIISAHYDSYCFPGHGDTAPGADDNASGTAIVLEAARILSNYSIKSSVIYALWDMEESGLWGSKTYADYAESINMNIEGVVNIDMVAWDEDNDGKVIIGLGGFEEFMNQANQIIEKYNLATILRIVGETVSDDASFYYKGYKSIGFWENGSSPDNDFNYYSHSSEDKFDKFNQEYFLKNARLIISSLAKLTL
jgi:hypothetical protein